MGMNVDFSEAITRLNRMQKKASKGMIDNALDKGAKPILEAQKQTVPVRKGPGGGKLRASLDKGKKQGSGSNRKIQVGIQNAVDREVTYGYYQEHGTRRMVGKKWMKKAWEKSKKQANEEIKKSIVNDLLGK